MVRFSSSVRNLALASGKFGIQKKDMTPQIIAGIPSIMKTHLYWMSISLLVDLSDVRTCLPPTSQAARSVHKRNGKRQQSTDRSGELPTGIKDGDPQRHIVRGIPERQMVEHARIVSCFAQPQEESTNQDASVALRCSLTHRHYAPSIRASQPFDHIQTLALNAHVTIIRLIQIFGLNLFSSKVLAGSNAAYG